MLFFLFWPKWCYLLCFGHALHIYYMIIHILSYELIAFLFVNFHQVANWGGSFNFENDAFTASLHIWAFQLTGFLHFDRCAAKLLRVVWQLSYNFDSLLHLLIQSWMTKIVSNASMLLEVVWDFLVYTWFHSLSRMCFLHRANKLFQHKYKGTSLRTFRASFIQQGHHGSMHEWCFGSRSIESIERPR